MIHTSTRRTNLNRATALILSAVCIMLPCAAANPPSFFIPPGEAMEQTAPKALCVAMLRQAGSLAMTMPGLLAYMELMLCIACACALFLGTIMFEHLPKWVWGTLMTLCGHAPPAKLGSL